MIASSTAGAYLTLVLCIVRSERCLGPFDAAEQEAKANCDRGQLQRSFAALESLPVQLELRFGVPLDVGAFNSGLRTAA